MTNVTFEVAAIDPKTVNTKYGPKNTYTLVNSAGDRYQMGFTDPTRMGIRVGTTVSGLTKEDKYGTHIDAKTITVGATSATPPPAPPPRTAAKSATPKPFPLPPTHGDTAIIRQNALTNAVSTVADYIATQPTEKWPDLDTWTDMVIDTAYKFAKFSSGQREVEMRAKLMKVGADAAALTGATATDSSDEEVQEEAA